LTLGSSTTLTEEERQFLQHRVGRFGLIVGCLFLGFLVFRVGELLFTGRLTEMNALAPSMFWHLASALSFLATWLVCRRGSRSPRWVRIIESVGLVGGCTALAVMSLYIPDVARPDMILLLAMTCAMVGRSVFVPSTGRRTLVLGLILGVDVVGMAACAVSDVQVELWYAFDPVGPMPTARHMMTMVAVNTAAWWAVMLTLCVAASRVIYGLRRTVRDAKQLGQYRLHEKIGEGGMGSVYRATHAMLARDTAIKLLSPGAANEINLKRFEREVQMTARLNHPNTVTVYDYGRTTEGVFYYAMELIDGASLQDIVTTTGALPPGRALHLLDQVAGALVEAHGVLLIHRDIKPANIMVKRPHVFGGMGEMAKVVDFGLVKESGDPGLTHADSVTGTPLYLSPEAIRDPATVTPSSDLYALGAVAYFLLTGTEVFRGKTVVDVCAKHLHEAPEPPSRRAAEVPADLEALVLACLEKDPGQRPASALELQAGVRRCRDFDTWSPEHAIGWWQREGRTLARLHSDAIDPVGRTIDAAKLGVPLGEA
jgi:serine/threonine-protein kinase